MNGNIIQPIGQNGSTATTDISSNVAKTALVDSVSNKYAYRSGNIVCFILRGTFKSAFPSLSDMDEIFTGLPKPMASVWFPLFEADFTSPKVMALVNVNQVLGDVRVGSGVRSDMAGKSFIVSGTYICEN